MDISHKLISAVLCCLVCTFVVAAKESALQSGNVNTDEISNISWNDSIYTTKTITTLQVVCNASLARASPIHDQAWKSFGNLNAQFVYVMWVTYPRLRVAQLTPCGKWKVDLCYVLNASAIIKEKCMKKQECTIETNKDSLNFGAAEWIVSNGNGFTHAIHIRVAPFQTIELMLNLQPVLVVMMLILLH